MNIVLHDDFHFEEGVAVQALVAYGERLHPGIKDAKVIYFGSTKAAEAWLQLHPEDIGVGVGSPYNEHNNPKARLIGGIKMCSADFVAEAIGLDDVHPIQKMLGSVRRADQTRFVNPSELPTLHKGWHRIHHKRPHVVHMRDSRIIPALIAYEQGMRKTDRVAMGMGELLDAALTPEQKKSRPGMRTVQTFLDSAKSDRYLEIARMFDIWQMLYPDKLLMIRGWAVEIIRDFYAGAVAFQEAFQSFNAPIKWMTAKSGLKFRYCILETDNPDMATIARIKGAHLIVNRRNTGNMQILTDAKFGFNLQYVVGALRIKERLLRGLPIPKEFSHEHWMSPENIPEDPCWYYLKAGELVLNGSVTSSRGQEPTRNNVPGVLSELHEHVYAKDPVPEPEAVKALA
jgi:hypothetical protein